MKTFTRHCVASLIVSTFIFTAALLVPAVAQITTSQPIKITSEAQLFIDDYLVAKAQKVNREFHAAEKYFPNPVLTYTEPWEGHCVITWGSVIYDKEEEIFKIWYEAYRQNAPRGQQSSLCYATSKDGLHWDKPILNLVEYDGSKANNILFQPKLGLDSAVIVKDTSDPDPTRLYK